MTSPSQSFIANNFHFSEAGVEMILAPELPLFHALPADLIDFDLMDFFFDYEVLPTFVKLQNKTLPYF